MKPNIDVAAELQSVGRGALIAGGGAVLAFLIAVPWDSYGPYGVLAGAVCAVAVNAVRKLYPAFFEYVETKL
jgi:hypothetical protein